VRRVERNVSVVLVGAALFAAQAGVAHATPTAAAGHLARPVASLVADIAHGRFSSDPRNLTVMNGFVYFSAWDARHGRQLWKTDGTTTTRLTTVDGRSGADPRDLTVADGVLFFSATDPEHGRELWKSDGTTAGTVVVDDIAPGVAGSAPTDITYAVGPELSSPNQVLVYFSAQDAQHGRELWKSDGTAAGTVLVDDIDPGPAGSNPTDITPLTGTTAMFAADDGTHGREPWTTGGTAATTSLYADLNPGAAGSDPGNISATLFQVGILAQFPLWYVAADDGTHGRELYAAYPGFPPAQRYDINPGAAGSDPGPFSSVAQQNGLIAADDGTHGRELVQLGTPPLPPVVVGSQPGKSTSAADIDPGPAGSDPVLSTATGIGSPTTADPIAATRTYLSANDGTHGRELWQADTLVIRGPGEGGTLGVGIADTRLVTDIRPGAAGSDPRDLTAVGSGPSFGLASGATELFSADDGRHGRELWESEGYRTNTRQITGIRRGPGGSDPRDITVAGQVAYFSADDGVHGRELWKVTLPPNPAGYLTAPLASVVPGTSVPLTLVLNAVGTNPPPTGSVTFYANGVPISTVPLVPAAGTSSAVTTRVVEAGAHDKIVAVYQGDGIYSGMTSNTALLTTG
jgi:ELWxxDGT repeat protein